jgi:hypothetical protein
VPGVLCVCWLGSCDRGDEIALIFEEQKGHTWVAWRRSGSVAARAAWDGVAAGVRLPPASYHPLPCQKIHGSGDAGLAPTRQRTLEAASRRFFERWRAGPRAPGALVPLRLRPELPLGACTSQAVMLCCAGGISFLLTGARRLTAMNIRLQVSEQDAATSAPSRVPAGTTGSETSCAPGGTAVRKSHVAASISPRSISAFRTGRGTNGRTRLDKAHHLMAHQLP